MDCGSLHQKSRRRPRFLSCSWWDSRLRSGSLPCEVQLVARPTVAHTGGYLILKRRRLGMPLHALGDQFPGSRYVLTFRCAYPYSTRHVECQMPMTRLFYWRISGCGCWVFKSGAPVMSEAGQPQMEFVAGRGAPPCNQLEQNRSRRSLA